MEFTPSYSWIVYFSYATLQYHEIWGSLTVLNDTPGSVDASTPLCYTGLSKKVDGIWNRYNLKSTGRIYTFGVLKCSEKFKVLDLP